MLAWLAAHWVDIAIAVVFLWYFHDGAKRGFLALTFEVAGFALALVGSFALYGYLAPYLSQWFFIPLPFAKPAAFFLLWMGIDGAYSRLAAAAYRRIPSSWRASLIDSWLGPVPALIDAVLLVATFLTLFISLPFPSALKKDVLDSRVGGALVRYAGRLDRAVEGVFGGAVEETISFLTVRQGSRDRVDLHFKTGRYAPDPQSESVMLALVNAERTGRGLKPLTVDPTLVVAARAHAADMLQRGYFAHVSPEDAMPTDRADKGGARYRVLGENLAYAPDVGIAHRGLMDSPGHRANILSREFGRVGIGIQDAGLYGLMAVQVFAD